MDYCIHSDIKSSNIIVKPVDIVYNQMYQAIVRRVQPT